jgi:hypothetical protein
MHGHAAGINWNKLYLTSATPGQTYAGMLVGVAGQNFMMREHNGSLVIGNVQELPPGLQNGDAFMYVAKKMLRP